MRKIKGGPIYGSLQGASVVKVTCLLIADGWAPGCTHKAKLHIATGQMLNTVPEQVHFACENSKLAADTSARLGRVTGGCTFVSTWNPEAGHPQEQ